MTATIHLGYEVGTGKPVAIPVRNLAITGQTQEAGKTTTLEALVMRSGQTALTFVTKRGEGSFSTGRQVQPYFRDRADWQFVTSIIDATLQEKNKFLRPWIMKICRTTKTLAEVQTRVRDALLTAKGINEGVYTQLDAYLDLIVPEIKRAKLAESLDLAPGLNVMDVSGFDVPMQMLFIQSAIDWINHECRGTILVMPEAWRFIPEGASSPVKASAVELVRMGSAIGNRIWCDSLPQYEALMVRIDGLVSVQTFDSLWHLGGMPRLGRKGETALVFERKVEALCSVRNLCWRPVRGILRHPYQGPILSLNTRGGVLDVSPNHPIVAGRRGRSGHEQKAADTLRAGDLVASKVFETVTSGGRALAGNQPLFIGPKDLAWFYGFFAAEGWISGKSVCVCNMNTSHLDRAAMVLKDYFHLTPCFNSPRRGVHTIEVRSPKLAAHLLATCYLRGQYPSSRSKTVPSIVLNGPPKIQQAWLEGYLAGDGHHDKARDGRLRSLTSVSRALLLGATYLLRGKRFTAHIRDDKLDVVQLGVGDSHRKNRAELKRIRSRHYDGFLYDLIDVVSPDHTYFAGIGNLRISNSQDMAGVDKVILRGCPVWVVGTQREANEIKRNLSNIPGGGKSLKVDDIRGLELGQFFVCHGRVVVKAYVQPAWMEADKAMAIAKGEAKPSVGDVLWSFMERGRAAQDAVDNIISKAEEDEVTKEEADALRAENERLKSELGAAHRLVSQVSADAADALDTALHEMQEDWEQASTRIMDALNSLRRVPPGALRADPRLADMQKPPSKAHGAPLAGGQEEPGRATAPAQPDDGTLKPGTLRLLDVLVTCHPLPLSAELWGAFANAAPRGGNWNEHMKRLREAGYIESSGTGYVATAAGIGASQADPAKPANEVHLWALWGERIREDLGAGALSLLHVLAKHRNFRLNGEQLGLLSHRSPRGGRWNDVMKRLRDWQVIEADGGYRISKKGLAIVNTVEPLDTLAALREERIEALPAKARQLWDALKSSGSSRTELAERTGLQPRGGHWNAALRALLDSGLVEDGTVIRPAEERLAA